MVKLKEHHRAFLVREFACFAKPSDAVKALKERFDVDITPQGAQHYDATRYQGKRISKKWKQMFEQVRQAFIDDVAATVPEATKAVRIRKLAAAAREYEEHRNWMGMARMLEQIAKEVGNVHTNRRELTGKGGGPIKFTDIDEMTDEMIDEELKRHLNVKDSVDIHEAPDRKQ